MQITVEMIETKEFKTKARGYDTVEVDEFLDAICDEMIALQDKIEALEKQLSQKQAAQAVVAKPEAAPAPEVAAAVVAPLAAPVPEVSSVSDSMSKILINAQRVSDETIGQAQQQAAQILADANAQANEVLASLQSNKDSLEVQVRLLKQAAVDYKNRFMNMMDNQKHMLEDEKFLFNQD